MWYVTKSLLYISKYSCRRVVYVNTEISIVINSIALPNSRKQKSYYRPEVVDDMKLIVMLWICFSRFHPYPTKKLSTKIRPWTYFIEYTVRLFMKYQWHKMNRGAPTGLVLSISGLIKARLVLHSECPQLLSQDGGDVAHDHGSIFMNFIALNVKGKLLDMLLYDIISARYMNDKTSTFWLRKARQAMICTNAIHNPMVNTGIPAPRSVRCLCACVWLCSGVYSSIHPYPFLE